MGSLHVDASSPNDRELAVGEELTNVFRSVWLRGQQDCRQLGLTVAQARLMMAVDTLDAVPPSLLARYLELTPQAMSSAMNHLEAEGIVRRTHTASDRRQVLVSFTPQGRRLFQRLRARHHAVHRKVNHLFRGRDRVRAVATLRALAGALATGATLPAYRCSLCAQDAARGRTAA